MNAREAERRIADVERTSSDPNVRLLARVVAELIKQVADLEEELRRAKQPR